MMAHERPPINKLPLLLLTAWIVVGCSMVYGFVIIGDLAVVTAGAVLLVGAMLLSVAYTVTARSEAQATAGGAVALVCALIVVTILLPSSGSTFVDSVILLGVVAGPISMFVRSVSLPSIGRTSLREISVAGVLLLPIVLAYGEALFLGLRFWESFPLGNPSYLFIPFLALWGYTEEALFRGVVQRSFLEVMSPRQAILLASALNAAYMLFWGSVMYALFALLSGMLLGYLFHRSRSLMYVGTVRALMDTWLVIAFLSLGIVMV